MAKYQIIKEYSDFTGNCGWWAYRKHWIGKSKVSGTYSITSVEDCEKNLRAYLNAEPPQVVKELSI